MAALSIRDLDDGVKARLQVRAAQHGRSMEAEVRAILSDAVADRSVDVGLGKGAARPVRCGGRCRAGPARPLRPPAPGDVRLTPEVVLDTNVVTELMRARPDAVVVATRNTGDFAGTGIRVVDPWAHPGRDLPRG